jgi:hypothetical protein
MNIQVSTSEGSEVGTIQNILGNSIVPGQSFIKLGALIALVALLMKKTISYIILSPIIKI